MADEILPGDCLPHGERRRYVAPHRFYIPEPGCTCERVMPLTVADDLDPAVERAARAGYDASRDAAETEPWDDLPEWGRETFRAFTRAALAAARAEGPTTPEHDAQVAARALRSALPEWMWASDPRDIEPGDAHREVTELIERQKEGR